MLLDAAGREIERVKRYGFVHSAEFARVRAQLHSPADAVACDKFEPISEELICDDEIPVPENL